jgi:hypothetical protein
MCRNEQVTVDSMDALRVERETYRVQASTDELVARIARVICQDGRVEPLTGLCLHRESSSKELVHSVSFPVFCVIAQGSKELAG